ncbi:hypothetical protein BH11CYA1_BH11CYA1_03330 [soil metagenome]
MNSVFRCNAALLIVCCFFAQQSALALSSKDQFKQAGSYETQGQVQKAKVAYSQLIKEQAANPRDPFVFRSQVRLARISLEQGDLAAANSVYQAALQLGDKQIQADPELMIDMDDFAETYAVQSKKSKEGKAFLLCALELRKKIDPHHPKVNESYRQLATYMIMNSNLGEAKRYIMCAINSQSSADTPKKLDRLAEDQMLYSEYQTAMEVTYRFAALSPEISAGFAAKCKQAIQENKLLRQKQKKTHLRH